MAKTKSAQKAAAPKGGDKVLKAKQEAVKKETKKKVHTLGRCCWRLLLLLLLLCRKTDALRCRRPR